MHNNDDNCRSKYVFLFISIFKIDFHQIEKNIIQKFS